VAHGQEGCPQLTDLRGIGPALAEHLRQHGFGSVLAVAYAEPEELTAVSGIGSARAGSIRNEARWLAADEAKLTRTWMEKRAKKLRRKARRLRGEARQAKSKKKRRKLKKKAKTTEAAARIAAETAARYEA
jgi:predicted flap endonuclease-1-like 5' DNA nuclease